MWLNVIMPLFKLEVRPVDNVRVASELAKPSLISYQWTEH